MHIYQEICNTQTGILELAEKHGFTNYKLFNQKEGLIPRSLLRNKLFQDMEEVIY